MAQENTFKNAKNRIDGLARTTQAYTQVFQNLGNITSQMRYLSTITTKIQSEVRDLNTKLQSLNIPEVDANVQNIGTLAGQMKNDLQSLYSLIPDAYPEAGPGSPPTAPPRVPPGMSPPGEPVQPPQPPQSGGYIWRKNSRRSIRRKKSKKTKSKQTSQRRKSKNRSVSNGKSI